MDNTAIAKQMIGFQKAVFNNSFNAMILVQDQTERMVNTFMGQAPWMTEENRSQMGKTFEQTKKAREDFKKAVDERFERFEAMFDQK